MTEADFWSRYVRPALHRPPTSIAWKMDPGQRPGFPDVLARLGDGRAYLLELKYHPTKPKRPSTVIRPGWRPGQRAHLVRWGPTGFLLIGVEDLFFLLPPLKSGTLSEFEEEAAAWGSLDDLGELLVPGLTRPRP